MGDVGLGYYKDIKYGGTSGTSSLSNCDVTNNSRTESEGKAAGVSVQEQSIQLVGAQEQHERGVLQVVCVSRNRKWHFRVGWSSFPANQVYSTLPEFLFSPLSQVTGEWV